MHRMGVALVLVGLLGLAQPADASTVLRFGTADLTDRAAVILHGKVSKLEAKDAGRGVIVTRYEINVYAAVKGIQGKTFVFTSYGGVLGSRGSAISGAPKYQLNEEVLVFLSKTNKYGWRAAIGLAQGKYTIRKVKGKKMAFRDLEGLKLLDRRTGVVKKAKKEQGVPLDSLLKSVKDRLKATKKKAGKAKKG